MNQSFTVTIELTYYTKEESSEFKEKMRWIPELLRNPPVDTILTSGTITLKENK